MENSTTALASATASPPAKGTCAKLREAIEEYNELDPSLRCDCETVIEIHRLKSQLDYGVSTTVAAFDQWGAFLADGALTAEVPAVTVADTIGAGDAFGGGFLAWWTANGATIIT